jgi:simple sugar transport system ATP-binding protein
MLRDAPASRSGSFAASEIRPDESMTRLLEFTNVSKAFGKAYALRDVNFHVDRQEIVGLLGDNGAGKSTLIKIVSCLQSLDSGTYLFKGTDTRGWTAARARRAGIETVYQDRALVDQQTIARNIFLGRESVYRFGFLRERKQKEDAARLMREIGFTSRVFSPDSLVANLSGGEKQGVAIARALHFQAELIIMDEPTTALSLGESQRVLHFARAARDKGASVIFITHTVSHAHEVSDRVVILDRGQVKGSFSTQDTTLDALIENMNAVAQTGHILESAERPIG